MYSTHNKGKSVVTERVIKTLKVKMYKEVTANDSKSYIGHMNKLVDECNNTDHRSVHKIPIDADYSVWLKNLRQILKDLNSKLVTESGLLRRRIF